MFYNARFSSNKKSDIEKVKDERKRIMILIKELLKVFIILTGEFFIICFFIAIIENWRNKK